MDKLEKHALYIKIRFLHFGILSTSWYICLFLNFSAFILPISPKHHSSAPCDLWSVFQIHVVKLRWSSAILVYVNVQDSSHLRFVRCQTAPVGENGWARRVISMFAFAHLITWTGVFEKHNLYKNILNRSTGVHTRFQSLCSIIGQDFFFSIVQWCPWFCCNLVKAVRSKSKSCRRIK